MSSPPSATGSATHRRRTPLTSSRVEWFEQAGLEVEVDSVGNLIGRIGGAREVWTNSPPRHRPRRGPLRRHARRRGGARGGRAARPAGPSRRCRLPRRGAAVRAAGAAPRSPTRTSSFTSSRDRRSSARMRRSVSSPRLSVTSAGGGRSPAQPDMPARPRWTSARGCALEAAEFVLHRARDVARGIDGAVATVGQLAVEQGHERDPRPCCRLGRRARPMRSVSTG